MTIERTTVEEMHCSMGGCSNLVRDVGMREGEGVYTIEEIAIDAGWKIEEFNGSIIHVCPRCSSDADTLLAKVDALDEVITKLLVMLKPGSAIIGGHLYNNAASDEKRDLYGQACNIAGRAE